MCQNVTANHRVNDAVFTEDGAQMVTGRFMYGPLDMVTLTGEKVMTASSCEVVSWHHHLCRCGRPECRVETFVLSPAD